MACAVATTQLTLKLSVDLCYDSTGPDVTTRIATHPPTPTHPYHTRTRAYMLLPARIEASVFLRRFGIASVGYLFLVQLPYAFLQSTMNTYAHHFVLVEQPLFAYSDAH